MQQRHREDLLADLSQVDTEHLVVLACPEVASRNAIDGEEQDHGDDEGPAETRSGVGKLVTELDPVLVDPTTGDKRRTIEGSDPVVGEEGGENVSNHTTNTVCSKDIKSIVVAKHVLETSGKVASGTTNDTKCDSSWGTDVTRGRGDSDQPRDSTGAEAHSRPLPLEPPVPEHPSQGTNGSSNLGNHHSLDSP